MQKVDSLYSTNHSTLEPAVTARDCTQTADAKTTELAKTILDLPLEMHCAVLKQLDLPALISYVTTSAAGHMAGTHNEVWASVARCLGRRLNPEPRHFDQVTAYLLDIHCQASIKSKKIPAIKDLTIDEVKTLALWVKAHDQLIVWNALAQKANHLNPALNLAVPQQLHSDDKLKVIEEAAKFPTWFRDNKDALNGLITHLNLSKKSLLSLPGELLELTGLRKLDVSENPICSLPAKIFDLTGLEELNLADTTLSMLPSEIGNLVNLKILNVSNNDLISIPEEIGNLAALETLNLTNNLIEHLPPQIGKNTRLKFLSATDNALQSIPDAIGLLTDLKFFLLRNNLLTTLPPSTGKLTLLVNLQLQENPLESLPPELLSLPNIKRVVQIESANKGLLNLNLSN